ncbi:MAG: hypothetical protein KJP00_06845, partial [Bacteroidia bacterium]|nr:hypothetical protein [Bacteroidia bacterium]
YKVGEIDAVEWDLFSNEKIRKAQQRNSIFNQLQETEILIKRIAFLSMESEFEIKELTPLDSIGMGDTSRWDLHIQPLFGEMDRVDNERKVFESSAAAPNVRLGYFAQSLEEDFLFHGIDIGVQIPIDKRSIKTNNERSVLRKMQLEKEIKIRNQQIENTIANLANRIEYLNNNIDRFQNEVQPRHANILDRLRKQYEFAEIDFVKFNQIQEGILEETINYLNWVKSYNESIIELKYWINE